LIATAASGIGAVAIRDPCLNRWTGPLSTLNICLGKSVCWSPILEIMTIFIPTPLRQFTGGKDSIEVPGATVAEALDALTGSNPDLRKHLFTPEGKVRAFVNLYLNDEDIRYLPQKEATAVKPTDTLTIIPSIAGGCSSL
jgi:sulfur-carrier protein